MSKGSFMDKPRMELTNYVAAGIMYVVGFATLVAGLFFPTPILLFIGVLSLAIISLVHYCWINTSYELDGSELKVRSGFYRRNINLRSIQKARVDTRYSLLAISPPLVKYRDRVSLTGKFGQITITPDDPKVFVKELQNRISHLELQGT